MRNGQASTSDDPVDLLVPRPPSAVRLAALLVGVVILLALLAALPYSGLVRPRLELALSPMGEMSAGRGSGTWEYRLENGGLVDATVESFDLGVPAATVTSITYLDDDDRAATLLTEPVPIPAGDAVLIRLTFTYDCALVPDRVKSRPAQSGSGPVMVSGSIPLGQRSTIRARGATPAWFTVDLGAGDRFGLPSMLVNLLGGACSSPMG
jgi:hypothetical protein